MSEVNLPRRHYLPEPGRNSGGRSSHIETPAAAETEAAQRIRKILTNEMRTSKRSGAWFRIGRMERGFLGLALRLKVRLESPALLKALIGVLKKLKEAGDGAYAELAYGRKVAWAFSTAAVSWGNLTARDWRNDTAYISFLGKLSGWRRLRAR